jgi:hypothetical protein
VDLCTHPDFEAKCTVNRFEDTGRFMLEVELHCTACREPFRFLGLAAGLSWQTASSSIDSLTAHLPVEPEGVKRLASSARYEMPKVPEKV